MIVKIVTVVLAHITKFKSVVKVLFPIQIRIQMTSVASARAGDPGGCGDSGEFGGTLSTVTFAATYMSSIWSLRCTKLRHSRIITCFDSMMCVSECYILFSGMVQYLVLKGKRTTKAM